MPELPMNPDLRANYEKYYEGAASEWRRIGAENKVKNIIELCSSVPHQTVLEIGSGDGAILERMSELRFGRELYSLEVAESAVRKIQERQIESLLECSIYDGYNIPYEDGRFDLAVMSHVLEHVEYPRQLLYEAARVATCIFIEVPLELNSRLSEDFVFDRTGHINFYTRKSIRRLVQSCGYDVVSQVVTNSSADVYRYLRGVRGIPVFVVKDAALRVFPGWATNRWTYHSALLCRPSSLARYQL